MDPILLQSLPSAASTCGSAEPGEKAGSPDAAQAGEIRFESVLKSVAAVQADPGNLLSSAPRDGRRAAIAAKEADAEPSLSFSVSPILWGSPVLTEPAPAPGAGGPEAAGAFPAAAAPMAIDDSTAKPVRADLPGAASAFPYPPASVPKDAAPTEAGPAPVLAGPSTLPAEADPLPGPASSGIRPVAAYVPSSAAPVKANPAERNEAAPASPAAPAPGPKDTAPTEAGPAPVLVAPSTLSVQRGALPEPSPPGIRPDAAHLPAGVSPMKAIPAELNEAAPASPAAPVPGPKVVVLMNAVRVDLPEAVPAFLAAAVSNPGDSAMVKPVRADVARAAPASPADAASEPKGAASAKTEGIPAYPGDAASAPEGARDAGGTRKKKDDVFPRNEGKAEPAAPPPADGIREASGRRIPSRSVGSAPDPGVVRLDEKAFVITRKSDTSVEVTLAPPGMGKLDLEVALEKGIVNARITAADSAGREAITRNLPQILEALARDGMNVGGFTVSLKERRDRPEDAPASRTQRDPDARPLSPVPSAASVFPAPAGSVDIFV